MEQRRAKNLPRKDYPWRSWLVAAPPLGPSHPLEPGNETRRVGSQQLEKGIVNRGKGKGTRNGVSSPAGRRGRESRDVHLSRAPPAPGTPSHPTGIDHVFLLPAASYRACVHFTRTYPPPCTCTYAYTRARSSSLSAPLRPSPTRSRNIHVPTHSALPSIRPSATEQHRELSLHFAGQSHHRKIPRGDTSPKPTRPAPSPVPPFHLFHRLFPNDSFRRVKFQTSFLFQPVSIPLGRLGRGSLARVFRDIPPIPRAKRTSEKFQDPRVFFRNVARTVPLIADHVSGQQGT